MKQKAESKAKPRLVRAGAEREKPFSPLRIVVGDFDRPPFPLDAVVIEDDTFHVLSAAPFFQEVCEHPVRILTEAFTVTASLPGTVIVRPGNPLRLVAVVHDLDREPTWREDWIVEALRTIFLKAEELGVRSLALPLPGSRCGRHSLPYERFMTLLAGVLEHQPSSHVRSLWLMTTGE